MRYVLAILATGRYRPLQPLIALDGFGALFIFAEAVSHFEYEEAAKMPV